MKIDLQRTIFFGMPLREKDVVSIVKRLDEKIGIFFDGEFDAEKQL
jgi:hypothetical protein